MKTWIDGIVNHGSAGGKVGRELVVTGFIVQVSAQPLARHSHGLALGLRTVI